MRPNQNLPPPARILDYIKTRYHYHNSTGIVSKVKGTKPVGCKTKDRGITIVVSLNNGDGTFTVYNTYAHRIAWYLTHDEWPTYISHLDGNKTNNRLDNLSITDYKSLLIPHRHKYSHYTVGITWSSHTNKHWRVDIVFNGKKRYLGRFETEEDAAEAYNQRAVELGMPTTQLIQTHSVPLSTSQANKKCQEDPGYYAATNSCCQYLLPSDSK